MSETVSKSSAREIAVVGIGNPERGDDGLGVEFVRRLAARGWKGTVVAGVTPENISGWLAALNPALVVAVDAVEMGIPAGGRRLLDGEAVAAVSASTHGCSLSLLLGFWERATAARTVLLGVQPARAAARGRGLSREAEGALRRLEEEFSVPDRTPGFIAEYLETGNGLKPPGG